MDSLIYFDPYLNVENSRGFQKIIIKDGISSHQLRLIIKKTIF